MYSQIQYFFNQLSSGQTLKQIRISSINANRLGLSVKIHWTDNEKKQTLSQSQTCSFLCVHLSTNWLTISLCSYMVNINENQFKFFVMFIYCYLFIYLFFKVHCWLIENLRNLFLTQWFSILSVQSNLFSALNNIKYNNFSINWINTTPRFIIKRKEFIIVLY